MSEQIFQETGLTFQPSLNLLIIAQRKIKKICGWLIFLLLILYGLYGIFTLFVTGELSGTFYFSILTDMFLFYLWQRRGERIKKIGPPRPDQPIEVSLFLDQSAQKSLESAWLFSYRKGYHFLRPIHLFVTLLKEKDFKEILKRLGCQSKDVVAKTRGILESSSLSPDTEKASLGPVSLEEKTRIIRGPKISSDFKQIFFEAYLFCLRRGEKQIGSLDILWAISQQANLVGLIFDEFGISPGEIERVVEWRRLEKEIEERQRSFLWRRVFKPKGKLNRAMTAALTPLLDKVSRDLTFLARQGQFEMVIGRDKEIEEIFNFFSAGQLAVVLVGQGQVGKKAVLKKIAQMMVEEDVPEFLEDKRLVQLEISRLVSLGGTQQRIEENLQRIIFEINRAGNIILVIEDVNNLAGLRSRAGGLDLAEILASGLDQKAFFFIGTASPEAFSSKIEEQTLGRVLNKVEIALPSIDALWRILITKIFIIERELKIFFSADALEQAIALADRYIYGKALPAKTMDLLVEIAYLIRQQRGSGSFIRGEDVVDLVARKTKIPLGELQETEKEKLLQLEQLIHQRVINQNEAVEAVAGAMRRSRLEMAGRQKPICNFLFIGPTGVGKTELAKTLARVYFGDVKRMIRLDMSEYQEKRGLRRLIGLRTEEGVAKGYLTEAIKRQPYSLLLLDEIEKAHPDILNLFLQVMDDGRLTDASGQTINFTDVILIATSNAGTQFIQEQISKLVDYQEIERQLKDKVLLEYFRPEFLNRFDKIVLFRSLTMDNVIKITHLFLEMVKEKIAGRGVGLEVEEAAVEELAQAGFDPLYGARPLRRVIQDKVENALARLFLENKIKRRDKLILKKGLVFEIKEAPEI